MLTPEYLILLVLHFQCLVLFPGSEVAEQYIHSPCGLFPSPLGRNAKAALVTKVKNKFKFMGKFIAKAVMDSRMVSTL